MTIYNASGITCQLGNFCFESMTLYTPLLAFKYSKIVIAGNGHGNGKE